MENNNKVKEVREANDIVDVISSYVPLTKKGKNYFGICPFHNDTNPSMSVSSEKQIYKCFSCGASGNVFDFVMDYENIGFKDALVLLAQRAGISLNNINTKAEDKNIKYYNAYNLALKLYQNNINTKMGVSAKDYLLNRNISEEAIKFFKVGLAGGEKDTLTKILLAKDYNIRELNNYGLSYEDKDLYQNRIMFPLFDLTGEVIGFSGRIYNMKSDSKYVNTKETVVFKKGELLYNYHNAKEECRKQKFVIVVEGFMDVIRLHMIGIYNVVALMGTALTKEQMSLLRKLATNVYLSLDGDEAGQKATELNGETLINNSFVVKVVMLTAGLDPDEYVIKYGQPSYTSLVDNALNFSDYKLERLKSDKDFGSLEDQSRYINQVVEVIAKEKDEIKKALLLDKLSKDFHVDINILQKALQNKQNSSKIMTFRQVEKDPLKVSKYEKAGLAILFYMLSNEQVIDLYEEKLGFLPQQDEHLLAQEIVYYRQHYGKMELSDFFTYLNDRPEMLQMLRKVLQQDLKEDVSMEAITDYMNVIVGYVKSQEIERLKEEIKEEPNPEKQAAIAEKIRLIKLGVKTDD